MIRNLNYQNNKPTLYLVPTPIGNLEDITFRSLSVLKSVEKIYAEDTRVTLKLLNYFNIKKTVDSLHEHNEAIKKIHVIDDLKANYSIALVSDAGMPLVSDPGYELVQLAITEGYNVVSLPGANALLPALAMSGIKTHPFLFFGFLDAKKGKRRKQISDLQYRKETIIIYEAIHRINETLGDLYDILGDRNFAIAREISKAYEEIIRGKLSEYQQIDELKGELVIIIDGYSSEQQEQRVSIIEQIDFLIESGMKKTEAMKKVSEMTGIPKNTIYQNYLDEKINKE